MFPMLTTFGDIVIDHDLPCDTEQPKVKLFMNSLESTMRRPTMVDQAIIKLHYLAYVHGPPHPSNFILAPPSPLLAHCSPLLFCRHRRSFISINVILRGFVWWRVGLSTPYDVIDGR
jgi:hypothetical protein